MQSLNPQFFPRSAQDPAVVYISEAEYDGLVRIAGQYANLCQNLISGGVNEATIQLLSNAVSSAPQAQPAQDLSVQSSVHADPVEATGPYGADPMPGGGGAHLVPHGGHQTANHHHGQMHDPEDWSELPSEDVSLAAADMPGHATEEPGNRVTSHGSAHARPQFERSATRSIQLSNLADDTTHADITAVVRGGLLLDIYLRRKDGTASLSFLNGDEAQAFYDHVRKNDLYINKKRVEIRWNERQYTLPGHLAQKIGAGATRNFVIRRCDASHTEASIREDLEHIHNLIVVKINFIGGDCYISTNSVANAMFARTCMMSRLKYKGFRIEWDLDECAQSLSRMPIGHRRRAAAPAPAAAANKQHMNPMANRFQLLNMDD